MSRYKMIGFDMDGTLLNSKKEITRRTAAAIEAAVDAGKTVVISTGRCMAEMREYLEHIPDVRYLVCCSGALVYDVKENRTVSSQMMPSELVLECLDRVERGKQQPMIHFLTEESIVQRDQESHMADYRMGIYQPFFDRITTQVDDIQSFYRMKPFPLGKLNFYHASPESRAVTRKLLEGLNIEMADAEGGSLECSPRGMNKAVGMQTLCGHLGIRMEEVIAVGDADNDLAFLTCAGLAVAMGNSNGNVLAVCDVVVRDCDHDGCADAVEKYLL